MSNQTKAYLRGPFDSGYEAGAEDAGSGELLVETLDLRYAFYDLDGKTKRAIALDELVMAVSVETLEHEEDCRCGLCRALEAVDGNTSTKCSIIGGMRRK